MTDVGKFDEPDLFVEPDVDEVFDRDRIKAALERLERDRPDLYARMVGKQQNG